MQWHSEILALCTGKVSSFPILTLSIQETDMTLLKILFEQKTNPRCTDPLYFQRLSRREWVPLRPQQELSRVLGSVSNDWTDTQLPTYLLGGIEEKVQEGRWAPFPLPHPTPLMQQVLSCRALYHMWQAFKLKFISIL